MAINGKIETGVVIMDDTYDVFSSNPNQQTFSNRRKRVHGYAPIDIYVNNQLVLGNYNGAGGYQWDTFDITHFAVEGNNTISLKFCRGASSNYWLRILRVEHIK